MATSASVERVYIAGTPRINPLAAAAGSSYVRAMLRKLGIAFLLLAGCGSLRTAAGELLIAAAADLASCIEELNAAYGKRHPDAVVRVTTGSSGNFFAQIKNGAPYDLFFSADMLYPKELVKAGLAESSSLTPYGVGRIVIWTKMKSLNVASRGIHALEDSRVKRIAIANPDHAPYGRAARSALRYHQLWEALESKLVLGENISQTAQFIENGSAEIGIIALSLALSPPLKGRGDFREIPPESYPPIEQGAVLTRKGAANAEAKRYLAFISTPDARAVLDRFGFHPARRSE